MNYAAILDEIRIEVEPLTAAGRVASYIPRLASISPTKFGMALQTVDGQKFSTGDAEEPFSIQSVSKVFVLTLAMQLEGDDIWKRVGREPSGNAFNSLVALEYENGIPRNPLINAGAIVLTDLILNHRSDPAAEVRDLVRRASGNESIDFDLEVAASEREAGHRNFALTHFVKSFGNLENDVDRVLDSYFRYCSLAMSCADLAAAVSFLAGGGRTSSGVEVATPRQVKRTNAVMLTCGVYDEAGDFAYRVGLPGKSGVGGGIVAVLPGEFSVAAWSPGLDGSGNSLAGTKALELLTTKTKLSVF